ARRHLRYRGAVGDDPGVLVQTLRATRLPDGADPPPLRDEGVVRNEDHRALLDHRRAAVRGRLRALLPLLLRPATEAQPAVSAADVEQALLDAVQLEPEEDVLVLGSGALALG